MSSRRSRVYRAVPLLALAVLAVVAACATPGGTRAESTASAASTRTPVRHGPLPRRSAPVTSAAPRPEPSPASSPASPPAASPGRSRRPAHRVRRRVLPRRLPATRVPQVPGRRTRDARGTGRKVVALTFDDGPGPYTGRVLRVLRREHVRATFFEIGRQVAEEPGLSRRLAAAGMSVQSHTWDHADLDRLPLRAVHVEDARASRAIAQATGRRPTCLRPPYGAVDLRVQRRLARDGLTTVTWDVDSEDWTRPGVHRIVARTLRTVHPGSVVLLHDGGGDRSETVRALPRIVAKLRARGYTFTTLCD